jgi:hypothetical protein
MRCTTTTPALTTKPVSEARMAESQIHPGRVCSKCGVEKPATEFGCNRTKDGRKIPRAQCRSCYNAHRREHYARPEVHAEKISKRKSYQARPDVREARNNARRTPEDRERDKTARDKYRSDPEAAARIKAQREKVRAKPTFKAAALLASSCLRARKCGLHFDLDLEWVMTRIDLGRCALTGIEFDFGKAPNGWRYKPSLSKHRPDQGWRGIY